MHRTAQTTPRKYQKKPGEALESPGKAHEMLGEARKCQEMPKRGQERPGEARNDKERPRRGQETPGEARRGQEKPRSRRPQMGGRDPTAAKKCPKSEQTYVLNLVAPNQGSGARILGPRRGAWTEPYNRRRPW